MSFKHRNHDFWEFQNRIELPHNVSSLLTRSTVCVFFFAFCGKFVESNTNKKVVDLIGSDGTWHMRMFDTVLESPKVTLLVFETQRNIV